MPELPEVEHTRRNLDRWMRGATLKKVTTEDARIVAPTKPSAFVRALTGRTVTAVERRGKWLRLLFEKEAPAKARQLFVHLGMTGWFEHAIAGQEEVATNPLQSAGSRSLRFERARFAITRTVRGKTRQESVIYVDPRRWGRIILAGDDIPAWTSLGPDPLVDGIDVARLAKKFARRKKQSIKEALMDQTVLAGVGNIQAIEALWKSKIDPRSGASAIGPKDLASIAKSLRWTIERTLDDLAKGDDGVDNPFKVYGRKGEPCPRCKTPLERFDLGGRTTTICPACQTLR